MNEHKLLSNFLILSPGAKFFVVWKKSKKFYHYLLNKSLIWAWKQEISDFLIPNCFPILEKNLRSEKIELILISVFFIGLINSIYTFNLYSNNSNIYFIHIMISIGSSLMLLIKSKTWYRVCLFVLTFFTKWS